MSYNVEKKYLLWLVVILPVSLHVLEAGEGGGGISNLSAVSLWLLLLELGAGRGPGGIGTSRLSGAGAARILKRHKSVKFHAAFRSCPTLGIPPEMVKPK